MATAATTSRKQNPANYWLIQGVLGRLVAASIGRRKENMSGAFAGQNVRIRAVAENIWLVSFMK
jgi:hypothetical protein